MTQSDEPRKTPVKIQQLAHARLLELTPELLAHYGTPLDLGLDLIEAPDEPDAK